MNPTLRDQLKNWKKLHQEPAPKKNIPVPKQQVQKKTENFSESDLKFLMGIHRPTYRRHKGALRQK